MTMKMQKMIFDKYDAQSCVEDGFIIQIAVFSAFLYTKIIFSIVSESTEVVINVIILMKCV